MVEELATMQEAGTAEAPMEQMPGTLMEETDQRPEMAGDAAPQPEEERAEAPREDDNWYAPGMDDGGYDDEFDVPSRDNATTTDTTNTTIPETPVEPPAEAQTVAEATPTDPEQPVQEQEEEVQQAFTLPVLAGRGVPN
jgi:hypothetical protein